MFAFESERQPPLLKVIRVAKVSVVRWAEPRVQGKGHASAMLTLPLQDCGSKSSFSSRSPRNRSRRLFRISESQGAMNVGVGVLAGVLPPSRRIVSRSDLHQEPSAVDCGRHKPVSLVLMRLRHAVMSIAGVNNNVAGYSAARGLEP